MVIIEIFARLVPAQGTTKFYQHTRENGVVSRHDPKRNLSAACALQPIPWRAKAHLGSLRSRPDQRISRAHSVQPKKTSAERGQQLHKTGAEPLSSAS